MPKSHPLTTGSARRRDLEPSATVIARIALGMEAESP